MFFGIVRQNWAWVRFGCMSVTLVHFIHKMERKNSFGHRELWELRSLLRKFFFIFLPNVLIKMLSRFPEEHAH